MAAFETLAFCVQEGVASIELNRPKVLNALNARMADELIEALALVRGDPTARVLVLHGAGGAFCAGGDLRDTDAAGPRSAAQGAAVMERFQRLTLALHDMDRPVIAAADGAAYGAGLSLLLLADIVLLSDRARLCLAFQRIGLLPDCGALFTLPRHVGLQRAKALAFSAREIGAAEAQHMGLALEVLSVPALLPRAMEMARAFCKASDTSTPLLKRALDASLQSDLPTMLALEASAQALALSSGYVAEAARRFADKAPPLFAWPGDPGRP